MKNLYERNIHLPISSGGGPGIIGGGINKPLLAVHTSNVSIISSVKRQC